MNLRLCEFFLMKTTTKQEIIVFRAVRFQKVFFIIHTNLDMLDRNLRIFIAENVKLSKCH